MFARARSPGKAVENGEPRSMEAQGREQPPSAKAGLPPSCALARLPVWTSFCRPVPTVHA